MTHRIVLVLTVVFSFLGRSALADKPVKIGVVDTEKILMASRDGKAVVASLTQQQQAKEKELAAQVAEIKVAQDKLTADKAKLSAAKFAAAQKDIDARTAAVRTASVAAEKELTSARDAALAAIDAKVMPALNAYAKAKGYTLIFRKFESGVIYVDDAIDITDDIVAALNK